jgi:hypothetical protein
MAAGIVTYMDGLTPVIVRIIIIIIIVRLSFQDRRSAKMRL